MKKNRRWLWLILIVIVVLIGWRVAANWLNRDVVSVKAAPVALTSIEEIIAASGTVDAPIYELGTKIGGKLSNLKVKEGDRVNKGQLLAEFDSYEQARNDFERTRQLYKDGAASKQAYDAAKTMFDASRIVAPNKGVVAKIDYREGETVVPGQPAIVVVNYDNSWVEAQIDEIDIANVKIGDQVKIFSDVYAARNFLGEIYWIAPLAELRRVGGRIKMDEESYVFPCKIKFLNGHEELKANMTVNVEIVTRAKSSAVVVPREALLSRDDAQYVFTVKNNRTYENKIVIGLRSYTSVEAISGVLAGDKVAITNVAKLKNKGRVKIEQ
ncbi:MAG: efflux RND transporter periplasmic adaptor subunit [Candidatus Margulisiibacteriota bacterium]|jgi:multidrug efflux pump subunit AcrA (membrane-fusion protein)